MKITLLAVLFLVGMFSVMCTPPEALTRESLPKFRPIRIGTARTEACCVGDFNNDGRLDIVAGEFCYFAPDWKTVTIRKIKSDVDESGKGYAWDFANIAIDVDGDGFLDVVASDWFDAQSTWFRNPGKDWKTAPLWQEHLIEKNGNFETLLPVNITGSDNHDILPDVQRTVWYELTKAGTFDIHVVSEELLTFGNGVGDVNGDGRPDIIRPECWFEAPADIRTGVWKQHPLELFADAPKDAAEIHVLDVNGDGYGDIIASAAHDYGIYWLEQIRSDNKISWRRHLIDDSWSQVHVLALYDIDADGQQEIVAGKRFMANDGSDPGEFEPLGIYWYKSRKTASGEVCWDKHIISYDEGIGVGMNIVFADMNGDGKIDIVTTGKFGGPILLLNESNLGSESGGFKATAEMERIVEADWLRQEEKLGRTFNREAVNDLLKRGKQLLESYHHLPALYSNCLIEDAVLDRFRTQLEQYQSEFDQIVQKKKDSKSEELYRALYLKCRGTIRELALLHPAFANRPIAFMKQRRAICQMFHEYAAYYYDLFDIAGGGLYILSQPGYSMETVSITEGKLPRGAYVSPSLSWDGKTIYFSYFRVKPTVDRPGGDRPGGGRLVMSQLPNPPSKVSEEFTYYAPNRAAFHLYAIDTNGENLRKLTNGIYDDTEPCELPDGRIAFMSNRRRGFIRCNSPIEPLETSTLHVVDTSGQNICQLSWHETNEWNPSILADGRILYTRWDYVDRDAACFHGLWTCNPDGSAPTHIFGSYTKKINAIYQGTAIPGSRKIAAMAGAHHANVGGTLILIDPDAVVRDSKTGEDTLDAVERITPEIGFSEVDGYWADSFYSSPVPLSEDHFLIAYSYDWLPGYSIGYGIGYWEDSLSGIYYLDRFGNKELIYRDEDISSVAPMILPIKGEESKPFSIKPPQIASVLDPELARNMMGQYHLSDVRISQLPLPADRPIKSLRIFEFLSKTCSHNANDPRIGHANVESARDYLGSVPVEADGSAYFQAPAHKPLFFQAVDENGLAVNGMHSTSYLQAGEKRSCIGCHEPPELTTAGIQTSIASQKGATAIIPDEELSGPLSFMRLIAPILVGSCVSCHDGATADSAKPVLTTELTDPFCTAYDNLRPWLRWYEWGGDSISQIVSKPGECGADASPLWHILSDENHSKIDLTDKQRRTIAFWLDANAPFYGTYFEGDRQLQRLGLRVDTP